MNQVVNILNSSLSNILSECKRLDNRIQECQQEIDNCSKERDVMRKRAEEITEAILQLKGSQNAPSESKEAPRKSRTPKKS